MKKFFSFLIILLSYISISAQFDTEHWFAPMADSSLGSNSTQYIYVSTNETVPFEVKVYNNNLLIATIPNLSKGNPQKFQLPRNTIITTFASEINVKNTMGLHLVADKKFFANIRFSIMSHAEIVTSKGKSALGKDFYIGMEEQFLPSSGSSIANINSMIGVIATEDNTKIKLSDYNPAVIFSDGSIDDEKNITLNKGESYIFEVKFNSPNPSNNAGLIGAHLTSDKPISVTNGNFLNIAENRQNYDILMDQSVPIERIGNEYVVLKGNGSANGSPTSLGTGFTEKVLVIATKDNTQIFVNDETTPIATLNKGKSYVIRNKFNNETGDIYNLYIKSNNPIYVYQFLAGATSSGGTPEFATGGMNFIPALSCYLPNSIDEIGFVEEMPYINGGFSFQNYANTKLNVITEKGATVTLNGGALSSTMGPFPLKGNNNWETYVIPNISGNVTLKSTKAVTAGIAAGSGAVGYGGYFAGFNSIPIISKGGSCDSGNVTLEVDNTYDGYQWYLNGNPYTGPGANSYVIRPTESGIYSVKINKSSCGSLDSPPFSFQRCPFKTTANGLIPNCNPVYKVIPTFSSSVQTVDKSTIKITTAPSNGTVSINPTTGEITYTLTNFTAITDSFTYSFSGTDPNFPDTEFVTVNLSMNYIKTFPGESLTCIKADKTGDFDLTKAKVTNDANITSTEYYENYNSSTKTFSNIISNFTSYNSLPKKVYAKLTNSYGCVEVAEIELKFYPIPNIDTVKYNSTLCDTDFDGLYEPDFTEISKVIVNNSSAFDIYYFDNPSYNFPALTNNWTYTSPTRVYVLVASKNGCTNATGFIDFKIGDKIVVNNPSTSVCDNDLDGKIDITLTDYNSSIRNTSTSNIKYFKSLNDASNNTNPLASNQTISTSTTYYARVEDTSSGCPNIATLNINFNQPLTSSILTDKVICPSTTTVMDAGAGFTGYRWSNGATTRTATFGLGNHYVDLYSNGCVYRQNFKITESIDPVINSVIVQDNNITVNVSGGNPPYYYSLDGINYQTSNVFTGLNRGLQMVYVQSAERCTPVKKQFLIINLINTITPNGDGINDVLDFSDLRIKKDVKILIFDRYGAIVFKDFDGKKYIWNGTADGRTLSTGTYWYILEWIEPETGIKMSFKNWVILKNRN